MTIVNKNPAYQPAGGGNNACKPRTAPAEAEAFSSCMRQSREQAAKGYEKPGYGKPQEEKLQAQSYAKEGKAKESAADHGKKNGKEVKSHVREGSAKESGASKQGSAKESGASKQVPAEASNQAPVDNTKSESGNWDWLFDFHKRAQEGMMKRLDSPGNPEYAKYRADVASGKEKYVSLEDFIKKTAEEYLERAKNSA
jgi:hypothetical protein